MYIACECPGGIVMELWSRRKFFLTSLAGTAIASANKLFGRTMPGGDSVPALANITSAAATGKRPLIISSANGLHALD
jgi:hypothetical protein